MIIIIIDRWPASVWGQRSTRTQSNKLHCSTSRSTTRTRFSPWISCFMASTDTRCPCVSMYSSSANVDVWALFLKTLSVAPQKRRKSGAWSQEHDPLRLGPRYTSASEQVQSWAYSVNHEEQPPEPGCMFEGPILSTPLSLPFRPSKRRRTIKTKPEPNDAPILALQMKSQASIDTVSVRPKKKGELLS